MTNQVDDPKARLISNLKQMDDQDGKHLWIGRRVLSIRELIDEVESDTDLGRKWVCMFQRSELLRSEYEARERARFFNRVRAFIGRIIGYSAAK